MYVDVSVTYNNRPSAYHLNFVILATYFVLTCILYPVEKRKETITDLPRQGGQKKKMGEYSEEFSSKINSIHVVPLIILDSYQHIFIHYTFNFTHIYLFC